MEAVALLRAAEREIRSFFSEHAEDWARRYEQDSFDAYNYRERARVAIELLGDPEHAQRRRVLELGCGAGIQARLLQRRGWEVVASDFSWRMVKRGARHGRPPRWLVCSVPDLPFRPGTFDAVILLGVIGYVPDPGRALRTIALALKPGGRIVVSWFSQPPYLLDRVGNAISAPLQRSYAWLKRLFGAPIRPPAYEPGFYRTHNRPWEPTQFLRLLEGSGYDVLDTRAVNFGQLQLMGKSPWGDRLDIALSRTLERLFRFRRLNGWNHLARTHVALAESRKAGPLGEPCPRHTESKEQALGE